MAKIYVIDDDEQMLDLVGVMARRAGHTPTLFSKAKKGLEAILENPPDLVILDVMMPGTSGHDIAREIRADRRFDQLPILVLTARSQDVDRQAALESGADDYLSKPVTSSTLSEKIDFLLSNRADAGRRRSYAGFVVSFFGLRGGAGRTTLAVNLAASLRQREFDVCLVDLTPSSGQAAHHLRLQAGVSWADLKKGSEAVTWEEIQPLLQVHSSGVQLLAAPAAPQSPLSPAGEDVSAWLELLQQHVDFVIVDLPALISPATLAAVGSSSMTIHLVAPDFVSVKVAVQAQQALTRAEAPMAGHVFVLNHPTGDTHVPPNVVERGLRGRLAFKIAHDPNQARALTHGIPLALADAQSSLSQATARVAEVLGQRVEALA